MILRIERKVKNNACLHKIGIRNRSRLKGAVNYLRN